MITELSIMLLFVSGAQDTKDKSFALFSNELREFRRDVICVRQFFDCGILWSTNLQLDMGPGRTRPSIITAGS